MRGTVMSNTASSEDPQEELLFIIRNHAEEPDDVDISDGKYGKAEIYTASSFVDDILAWNAKKVEEARLNERTAVHEQIRGIHMGHNWNEMSPDLRDWLVADLHNIQVLQDNLSQVSKENK